MRADFFSLRSLTAVCMLSLTACSSSEEDTGFTNDPSGEVRALGEFQQGIATWYEATGAGHCGYDASPEDMDVAAMNAPQFAGSAVCGSCAEIEGPNGTVRVRIVDSCPECAAGHLDLSKQAFEKIAPLKDGRVKTRWRPVTCAVKGSMRYHIKEGSSKDWTAIQVRNHRYPISKLELQGATGDWMEMKRENYNYFTAAPYVDLRPLRLRVTASDGQRLEDSVPRIEAKSLFEGAAQFPLK
jgi:expansin